MEPSFPQLELQLGRPPAQAATAGLSAGPFCSISPLLFHSVLVVFLPLSKTAVYVSISRQGDYIWVDDETYPNRGFSFRSSSTQGTQLKS